MSGNARDLERAFIGALHDIGEARRLGALSVTTSSIVAAVRRDIAPQ